ncbi:hypothetical protein [Streptomyces sp. NPDC048637]|uniref:hypothetical protein n=1 Tax=Streptomyces sp. NPDC048637 TaxID=3155636 RepID=UPI003430964D
MVARLQALSWASHTPTDRAAVRATEDPTQSAAVALSPSGDVMAIVTGRADIAVTSPPSGNGDIVTPAHIELPGRSGAVVAAAPIGAHTTLH